MATRLLLLRWVLVLATVYLVWFSGGRAHSFWVVATYVLAYLLSAPVVHRFVRHRSLSGQDLLGLIVFDVLFVCVGLVLAHPSQLDFYPVVFLALFVAAVALDLRAAVAASVLLGVVHLAAIASASPEPIWYHTEDLLRIPFLLAVGAFFGYLCQEQRRRERRRVWVQRQRDRLEALAAAAHDIRSPLANVVSLTEMLLAGDAGEVTDDQRDLLERAHADLWRVVRRATNLMDAARLDRQALPLEKERLNLSALCAEVVHSMETAARIRRIRLVFEDAASTKEVFADRAQIERAVSNLLDNAIKYSPANGSVWVRVCNPSTGWVAVEVVDQGPGIPQEHEGLFQPFTRMHAGPPISGSGLGLFIVHKIVVAHGGSVSLEGAAGGGTCARILLPVMAAEPLPRQDRGSALRTVSIAATSRPASRAR